MLSFVAAFFSLLTFIYLFFYLSPCASLYLIKGYWWRKMWSQFSICDRTPPSSCEEAAVCSTAPATSHPHTYFRWLVLLAVTVTGKKTCVSCIYLTDFIDHFFLSLILIPWRRLESTSPQKNSNTKGISSVYTFSDQLLLYLIYFHLQNTLVLISTNLHLWWKPIILTHITITNAVWFLFFLLILL